ncbi:MAG: hypothetical protein Q7T20_13995, partial [Saprospiraceae bacterium]|nr:hypothetical protein [Saprospiraceae bacterium]
MPVSTVFEMRILVEPVTSQTYNLYALAPDTLLHDKFAVVPEVLVPLKLLGADNSQLLRILFCGGGQRQFFLGMIQQSRQNTLTIKEA